MRFDTIQIPAFGPFTDFSIDFKKSGHGAHDIHLVYGANEAGKSSLLRGIHQMFYSIPGQTKDNFIHNNKNLRVGATISDANNQLSFLRKKGNKNTLLDTQGNTIDDSALDAYLGSVNDEFFDSMFGLDTQSLREGADALLSGEGDLGTQLFSASLGGTPIEAAIAKLEDEANALYKGSSKVGKTILPALNEYKAGEKGARSSATKVTAWNALLKDIRSAQAAFDAVDKNLSRNQSRTLKLSNLTSALPTYTKFLQLSQNLEQNTAPAVSSDFVQRFRSTLAEHKDLSRTLQIQQQNIETQQQELAFIPDSSATLQHEVEIEALTNGYETYLANLETVEHLQSEIEQIESTLQLYSEQLELSTSNKIDQLSTITETVHSQFKQLAHSLSKQDNLKKLAESELAEIESSIAQYEADLKNFSNSADTSLLEDLTQRCETHHAEYTQHEERVEQLESLSRVKNTLTSRLSLDSTTVDIPSLAVPSKETIIQEQQREIDLLDKIGNHQQKIESCDDELAVEQTQLDQLKKQTAIYSHRDLLQSRADRDTLLSELTSTLSTKSAEEKAIEADDLSQLTKLSEASHHADNVADALHSNAENIAKAETHLSKIETLALKKENAKRYKQEVCSDLERWKNAWQSRCAAIPVEAQSPSDLIQWREQWEKLCATIDTLSALEHKTEKHIADQQELIQEIKSSLSISPSSADDSFRALFSLVKSKLKAATRGQGKLESAQTALTSAMFKQRQATEKLNTANTSLAETHTAWGKLCSASDIAENLHPEQILDLIDKRNLAQQKYIDFNARLKELNTKSEAIKHYNSQTATLVQEILDHASGDEAEETTTIVPRLKQHLATAQQRHTKANTIQENITSEQKKLPDLELKHKELTEELQSFLQQANVENLESMEEAVLAIETKIKLNESLDSQRDTLQQLAKDVELDVFFTELAELDHDEIAQELEELSAEAQPLQHQRDSELKALDELKGQQQELQKASDTAASHKQDAANALARLVTDTERFIKLQHAITFLREQVEAFRKKTQGPMMVKTSHYFSALTSNRYSGVAAQLDDKGKPQLVALRRDSDSSLDSDSTTEVHTTGLSEGTADQLYLALRLAAIDLHLDNHPPIPLILDDLLMTFDDDRTRALLPVLEELSQKTQILIFTHHHHLTTLTKEISTKIQQHQLSA